MCRELESHVSKGKTFILVWLFYFRKGDQMIYDIAIIGAGIVGAMTAMELSKYDVSLCIIEKESDVATGASKANSGIVHAGFDAITGSQKAILNVEGSRMMERLANELGVKYRNNGSMVLAFDNEDMSVIKDLYERGNKNGVEKLEIIYKDKLRQSEPNISENAIGALYAPTGAIVCPYELTIAATGLAMDNKAELMLENEVIDMEFKNFYYEIKTNKGTVKAKYIINAAGIYADKIAQMAGDDSVKIRPRKGEYILLDKECAGLVKHTIFKVPSKMGKGVLISPTVDNNIIVGPTSEYITDKEDKSTTQKGIGKIINDASLCVANIPFKSVITSFSGLRAVPDNGDFIIANTKPNFINAAGIESPGLTASPAIAILVVNILKQMGVKLIKKTEYSNTRKIYIADKNKYNKIVCRCEKISEGKIIESIHTNPKALNVDAIKRRTRSGMGRCQGGFCITSVVEILARELNVDMCDVTKSGGESKILTGKKEQRNEDC